RCLLRVCYWSKWHEEGRMNRKRVTILALLLCSPVCAANADVPPQVVYEKAWRLVKVSYYDQGFNRQDWRRWEHRYDGKLKTSDDAHQAIQTMLASLRNPYTRFLDNSAFNEDAKEQEPKLIGVGMQLGMNKEHQVIVIAPIDGSPALKAGVQSGDQLSE